MPTPLHSGWYILMQWWKVGEKWWIPAERRAARGKTGSSGLTTRLGSQNGNTRVLFVFPRQVVRALEDAEYLNDLILLPTNEGKDPHLPELKRLPWMYSGPRVLLQSGIGQWEPLSVAGAANFKRRVRCI